MGGSPHNLTLQREMEGEEGEDGGEIELQENF